MATQRNQLRIHTKLEQIASKNSKITRMNKLIGKGRDDEVKTYNSQRGI